jgi:sterol 14-demethylase
MQDLPVPPSLAAPSESKSYVIPKGYYVLASPTVSGVDPNTWSNPNEWDPYRWLSADGTSHGAKLALKDEASGEKIDYGFGMISKGTESPYQPFGAGRHRCIGESFAYVQLGSVVATLVRNLEFRSTGPFPQPNYHVSIPRNLSRSVLLITSYSYRH